MCEDLENTVPPNTWQGNVEERWCDYNGHLNLAYYVVIFDLATDAFYDTLDLGEAYKNNMNHSWFTAEAHVCYLSEVVAGTEVRCTTQLIGFDDKRMHYFHRMYKVTGNLLVATNELLALHIDLEKRRVEAAAPNNLDRLNRTFDIHHALPKPSQLGSKISIPTPVNAR